MIEKCNQLTTQFKILETDSIEFRHGVRTDIDGVWFTKQITRYSIPDKRLSLEQSNK